MAMSHVQGARVVRVVTYILKQSLVQILGHSVRSALFYLTSSYVLFSNIFHFLNKVVCLL